jgi:hypothetical protein
VMPRVSKKPCKKNREWEDRLHMEIIVDAYGPEEQAMSWYYYLRDKLSCPFVAECVATRAISPLRKGDKVEVIGMAPEDECGHEMFVEIRWERRKLGVPLAQVKPGRSTDAATKEAVADWHYWVERGYEL